MEISAINSTGIGYMQSTTRPGSSNVASALAMESTEENPAAILNISGEEQTDEMAIYTRDDILEQSDDDNGQGLTDSEETMVNELEERDSEVRRHEEAHAALLGHYAIGGPAYTYQVGPDGRSYAVGGSVTASTGEGSTPEETIAKARVIAQAAGGGGEASAADSAAMMGAYQMAGEAFVNMSA